MKEMKEKIYDARTGMEYILIGDYYLPALKVATDSSGWPLGDAAQGVPETAKTSLLSEPAAEWKAGRCFGRRGRTGSRAI